MVIIDASTALSWVMPQEATDATNSALAKIQADQEIMIVPSLWLLEVTNVIVTNLMRRKRISQVEAADALNILQSLDVQIDALDPTHVWGTTYQFAITHELTTYDAAYLELAYRLKSPILTNDDKIIEAAKRLGVFLYNA